MIQRVKRRLRQIFPFREILGMSVDLRLMLVELRRLRSFHAELRFAELMREPRYCEPGRLHRATRQVHSQTGQDGIIDEIFARIGAESRFFVEFGVESGIECNTANLLIQGWRGLWIETRPDLAGQIRERFAEDLAERRLTLIEAFVSAENIEDLLSSGSVPEQLDLLGIDIAGNDYWVWKAIQRYSPRVVVMPYNAVFPPHVRWVQRYDESGRGWGGDSYFGASLASLASLGAEKGYSLVGCDIAGIDAFFVRADLCKDHFAAPFTAENHYEPLRGLLTGRSGQTPGYGPFVRV